MPILRTSGSNCVPANSSNSQEGIPPQTVECVSHVNLKKDPLPLRVMQESSCCVHGCFTAPLCKETQLDRAKLPPPPKCRQGVRPLLDGQPPICTAYHYRVDATISLGQCTQLPRNIQPVIDDVAENSIMIIIITMHTSWHRERFIL